MRTSETWLSAHLYFDGHIYALACDRVILDVVSPFVRQCREQSWIQRYFFIRYYDDGPHVRLRLQGEADVLNRKVRPALLRHVETMYPYHRKFQPRDTGAAADGAPRVRWIAYEPELDRYGGADGIRVAEQFFHHSSEASIALLSRLADQERSSRLGKGLLAMVVLLHAFMHDRAEAASFSHRYGTGYLTKLARNERDKISWISAFTDGYARQADRLAACVGNMWSQLDGGGPLTAALDTYHLNACGVREGLAALHAEGRLEKSGSVTAWMDCVCAIVPGYMHMMNNRLGIAIPEESYLAHVISRALHGPVAEIVPSTSTSIATHD